jgi:hypothetical protein
MDKTARKPLEMATNLSNKESLFPFFLEHQQLLSLYSQCQKAFSNRISENSNLQEDSVGVFTHIALPPSKDSISLCLVSGQANFRFHFSEKHELLRFSRVFSSVERQYSIL